jgi:hypothetical protein
MTAPDLPFREGAFVPGAPVALPTPKSQEMILVRRSEIRGIRRRVDQALTNPVESASAWAFTWLGTGIAAGLSLGALVGVSGNHVKVGVIAGHCTLIVCGFFLAAFCGWIDRKNRQSRLGQKHDLCAELDELDERAPTTVPEG